MLRTIAVWISLLISFFFSIEVGATTPMVAVGGGFTAVLQSDGRVMTWGDNLYGQLGNGVVWEAPTPLQIPGLASVQMISAGYDHVLALKQDGTVWAWGSNMQGQLGDCLPSNRNQAAQVKGLDNVIGVVAGQYESLAVKKDGTVWQWGTGRIVETDPCLGIKQVPGLSDVKAVVTTAFNYPDMNGMPARGGVALKNDGTVWAWGRNSSRPAGGSYLDGVTPVQVPGLSDVVALIGADYDDKFLAQKRDGSIWLYQYSSSQLSSDGSQVITTIGTGPVRQSQLDKLGITQITFGAPQLSPDNYGFQYLAITADGTAYQFNSGGNPQAVTGLTGIVASSGYNQPTLLKQDGTLWQWSVNSKQWTRVSNLEGVAAVSSGSRHLIALKSDGTVWGWGANREGELGIATLGRRSTPGPVSALANVQVIAAGEFHALALKQDGTVWGWGYNNANQIGDNAANVGGSSAYRSTAAPVPGLSQVTAIAAGSCHSLALKQDGTVWRLGAFGPFALFTACPAGALAQEPGLSQIVAIASSDKYSLALKQDGTVWAFGIKTATPGPYFDDSQVGSSYFSYQMPGLANITAIAAAPDHAMALGQDGSVWTWGDNKWGQLGDGTNTSRSNPVRMLGLGNVRSIAAANGSSLAIKQDGSLWVAGAYGYGIGGDFSGNLAQSASPVQIAGLTNVQSIATGKATVAIMQDGTVMSWGNNASGQLGDGTYTASNWPGYVVNETATGLLTAIPGSPISSAVTGLPYLLSTQTSDAYSFGLYEADTRLAVTLTSLPWSYITLGDVLGGLPANVYFSAFHRDASTNNNYVPVSFGASGFKQTGATAPAEAVYSGSIHLGSTWTYGQIDALQVLYNTNDIVCFGISFPALAAKGMVLMRQIYQNHDLHSISQCPPVQTPMTSQIYQGQASGPLNQRRIVAQINPLDEDRGKTMNVYSWAAFSDPISHSLLGAMQTSTGWAVMSNPLQAAMTLTVPASGPITLVVADGLDLSTMIGTRFFIGLGASWDEVKTLNRAGNYYTVQ